MVTHFDWPPADLRLPDSIEEIERGRIVQSELFVGTPDDSREGRLRRIFKKAPGVRAAHAVEPQQ